MLIRDGCYKEDREREREKAKCVSKHVNELDLFWGGGSVKWGSRCGQHCGGSSNH